MSKIAEPYRCDGCGKLRETDANRWWLLGAAQGDASGTVELVLFAWESNRAALPGLRHACGEDCTQKLIARWMQSGSFDAPSQRPVSGIHESVKSVDSPPVPTREEGSNV